MGIALVLPAAGSGSRFAADGPAKQFRPLLGRPVMMWTLEAFRGLVDAVIIVASPEAETQDYIHSLLALEPAAAGHVAVVSGGATRQASVAAGLKAVPSTCDRVLIHDAARPLVPERCIQEAIKALETKTACVVAIPATSTVKKSLDDHTVAATVPREELHLAQTPQGVHLQPALEAFARAEAEHWQCSDDAQVMERCGHEVALVLGDAANLKITTPDDWAVAQAILSARADAAGVDGPPS